MRRQISNNPKFFKQLHAIYLTKGTQNPSHWSNLIKNYIAQGFPKEALVVYTQRSHQGIHLAVIPLLLKACAALSLLFHGRTFHAEYIKIGIDTDIVIGTSLVNMYAKCDDVVDARKLFDEMPKRNVVTYNAMIGGYSRNGDIGSALLLFDQMTDRSTVTWTEMIDGYARIGNYWAARLLFDQTPLHLRSVVTWTVMVDGYARNGEMEEASQLFEEMPQRNFFVWSSMIAGYCKRGDVNKARSIFERIPLRNSVNWNSLIAGYAQNGFCKEALEAFREMQAEGFDPDEVTVASVLSACGQLGLLDTGREIHEQIKHKRIRLNQFVLNGLVDMYAKCGDVTMARYLFEGMTCRNDVCWNAMISGFAVHGRCKEALEFFARMEESQEKPNEITFLAVLSACAHGGFVNEGLEVFRKMGKEYGLVAGIKHYGCLVDLLGRGGRLNEAYDLIKRMPLEPNDAVWGALLGACKIHMDMEMAERVVKDVGTPLSQSECNDDARYVLLSNIYAASDKWEEAEKIRMVMMKNGVQKIPGCSSILTGSTKHRFHAGAQAESQTRYKVDQR